MGEEIIRREASLAIDDLELDVAVTAVTQSGDNWCVQFAGDYTQFCDTFKNQFKRDNSPRVIREKIKKHLMGQITQLRNKGRNRASRTGFDAGDSSPNVTGLMQDAVTQTARAVGEAIDRTLGITTAAIKSAGDLSETLTAKATETLSPPARTNHSALPSEAAQPPRASLVSTGRAARAGKAKQSEDKTKRGAAKKKPVKKTASKKKATAKRAARKGARKASRKR
jgi:hypothetical protein